MKTVSRSAYRGDTIKINGAVTRKNATTLIDEPINLTTHDLTFTLKSSFDQADPGLCQKTKAAGITIYGVDSNLFEVVLLPGDTEGEIAPADYYWDTELVEVDGTVTTIAYGILRLYPDVTTTPNV